MEDWVQLHSLLKKAKDQPVLESNKGKISVKGTAGTNASHTINEDERTSFTDHINGVCWLFPPVCAINRPVLCGVSWRVSSAE
jgi:hypothetical protein